MSCVEKIKNDKTYSYFIVLKLRCTVRSLTNLGLETEKLLGLHPFFA